jgi:tRNA(Ser,Leu) C12 N-acetylase TAN1
VCNGCGRFSRAVELAKEAIVIDWNVIVTVRHDFDRASALLRKLGAIQRTGLYNVLVMRVPDIAALLEQIAQQPADERFFATISHVVPITHKLWFATAEDFERKARDIVLAWAPQLAGKSVHVRMRRRGHKGELHRLELERRLGVALLEELARRGTPGRIALDDPDAVIAIETLRDEAGLALWTRADLERYPFLRASIERGESRQAPVAVHESAPSRTRLAAASKLATRSRTDQPASASEIVDLLGELEPLTLEKLVATGATIGEVAEAVSAIEDEDSFGELHHAPSSPREAEVRAILEDLVFESFEERESERDIART